MTAPVDTLHRLFALIDAGLPLAAPVTGPADPLLSPAMAARAAADHPCVMCRRPASAALLFGPSDLVGAGRWLDACWACYKTLRELGVAMSGGGLDLPGRCPPACGDAAIVIRYAEWKASR